MDQDDHGFRPSNAPDSSDLCTPNWSATPFEGSPNTAFAVASPNGTTFIPSAGAHSTSASAPAVQSSATTDARSRLLSPSPEEFRSYYERHEMNTNLLLVCYIPMDIKHTDFSDTMDRIQQHLRVHTINNYYRSQEFSSKFGLSDAPWWEEGFSYETEKHASFLLRLGGHLPFAYHGKHNEVTRPMVFTIAASPTAAKIARMLAVQPVPPMFDSTLLRPPVAIWRGVGMDADAGHPAAVLALVTLYVTEATKALKAHELQRDWVFHSFLSPHVVDVKSPTRPPSRPQGGPRGSDRGRSRERKPGQPKPEQAPAPNQDGPTQVHYTELFIFTVCSAPTGELPNCYGCLISSTAPFNLSCYPLSLCGWWVELTQTPQLFMSNDGKVGPNIELLQPRPATRVMGLKAGCSLSAILTALDKEGQHCDHIAFGYLHRSSGGDSCTLITDGRHPLATSALRSWTSNTILPTLGDLEDMRRLRDKYTIFRRSLGLPAIPSPSPVPYDPASLALVRPGTSYGDVARHATNATELTSIVQSVVLQQVAAASRAVNNRFSALEDRQTYVEERQSNIESTQSAHTTAISTISADHVTMQQTLRDTCAEVEATQEIVADHTRRFGDLTTFLETQHKVLEDQDARMQQLDASLRNLSKRRAPEAGLDFTKPRGSSDHEQHDK